MAPKPTPAKTNERVAYLEQQVKLLPKEQQKTALNVRIYFDRRSQ